MEIVSIDNAYEEDGLVNVTSALAALNRQTPGDTTNQQLVAILPEYSSDGRLDRLNVCTVPVEGTERGLGADDVALMDIATRVVTHLQARRAEALRKLDEAR